MDEIRIPNRATYSPVALADLVVAAPLASRVLLGATLPGRLVQAAALGAYVGSAAADWARRLGARRIDFLDRFGADVSHLEATPPEVREREAERLAAELSAEWRTGAMREAARGASGRRRRETARRVDGHLTDYIAAITGQRVRTSTEVRSFTLAGLLFPFAAGACDLLSGDVALFRPLGLFEPHVIAHEFAHRKGYWKELEAQALAYLALVDSEDPALAASARCELLHRQLSVLARLDLAAADRGSGTGPPGRRGGRTASPGSEREVRAYRRRLEALGLPEPLEKAFRARAPEPSPARAALQAALRRLYDERLRLTGQNGLSDYDEGFTDFLYTAGLLDPSGRRRGGEGPGRRGGRGPGRRGRSARRAAGPGAGQRGAGPTPTTR